MNSEKPFSHNGCSIVSEIIQSIEKDSVLNPQSLNKNIISGYELLSRGIMEIPTLVNPIIPQTGLIALCGGSDTGKSSFLRQLLLAIISSDEFLSFKLNTRHKRAYYVSSEDDEMAISYLLNKQNRFLKIPIEKFKNINFIFQFDNVIKQLNDALTNNPADIVVIDAFADFYPNDIKEVNKVRCFLEEFNQLAKVHKCLFCFLHHTGKRTEQLEPSKNNIIGSQGFESKMRFIIELRQDHHDSEIRHMCIVKGNYLPSSYKNESYVLRFNENMCFEMTDERMPFEKLGKAENFDKLEKIDKAKELRDQGKSIKGIADIIGASKSTIHRWCK